MLKKYGTPILILFLMGLSLRYVGYWLRGQTGHLFITLLRSFFLFWFGLSLHPARRRRHEKKKRKVLLLLGMVVFLSWELRLWPQEEIKRAIDLLGIDSLLIHLWYVYTGWSFFD